MARISRGDVNRGAVVAAGAIPLGLVLTFVGGHLQATYRFNAAVCNTYGGSATSCTANEGLFTLGQFLEPIGVAVAVLGLIGLIAIVLAYGRTGRAGVAPPGPTVISRAKTSGNAPADDVTTPNLSAPSGDLARRSWKEQDSPPATAPPADDDSDW